MINGFDVRHINQGAGGEISDLGASSLLSLLGIFS